MQKIRIYGFAPSTYTQTARLVAAELDVAAELCPLEFKQPSHFERHPFGKMPAFEHGDVRLFETLAIAAYLIEAFPTSGGPELLPRAPADRARVLQWVSVAVDYAYEDLVNRLHADEPETEQRTAAAEQLTLLERGLGGLDYFGHGSVTLADLFLFPMVSFARRKLDSAIFAELPQLAAWTERLAARPTVRALDGLAA